MFERDLEIFWQSFCYKIAKHGDIQKSLACYLVSQKFYFMILIVPNPIYYLPLAYE